MQPPSSSSTLRGGSFAPRPLPALGLACAFALLACSDGPEAAGALDLDALCTRLHVTARDGHGEEFLAAAKSLVGGPSPFPELLRRLEAGEYDEARLDETVGALDLGVRLLAEESSELHADLRAERAAYLGRAVASLTALPPIYAQAMLNRWGQWGYLRPDHAPALVKLAALPDCRALALRQLAEVARPGDLTGDELDLLSGLLAAQELGLDEKADLVAVLLTRGDGHDLVRLADFLAELGGLQPRWDLVGVLLRRTEHEATIRAAIDGLGSLSWVGETAGWRDLGATNEVVSQLATGLYFQDPASARGRAAFALAQGNRAFLETVWESAQDPADRWIALEMLVREHLPLAQAIASVESAVRRDGAVIATGTELGALLLDTLGSLSNRAARQATQGEIEALTALLGACRSAVPHPAQARTLGALTEFARTFGAR